MQTTVPRSLEKRREILQALHALGAQDQDEAVRRRRAEIAALRRDLQKLALAVHELRRACDPRLRSYVIKYSPDQPRVPAGNLGGGQWTSEGKPVGGRDVHVAASGGLRCDGFAGGCQSGGSYGTSGMFNIEGRVLCMDCAVKFFSLQDETPAERARTLDRFLIKK